MRAGSSSFEFTRRSGRGLPAAIGLTIAVVVSGCTTAGATPGPSASAIVSPSDSGSTAIASPSSTVEASLVASPHPLAGLKPAPSGRWTGLDWHSVPPSLGLKQTSPDLRLFGWSRGYVAFSLFTSTPLGAGDGTIDETLDVSSSPDGLNWTPGKRLDTSSLDSPVVVAKVVEGPAGLLAVGMPVPGACGGPASVTRLWTSTDGNGWTDVDFAGQFGKSLVWTVDAGSTGYVATGDLADGTTQVMWASDDGRTWRRSPIPAATFGTVIVQGATAFSGGFVVSGAVRGDDGCGGPRYVTPSLWWSSDAKSWTRVKLTGTTSATNTWMSVTRITDRALLAVQTSTDGTAQSMTTAAWVSHDGRTWTPVSSAAAALEGNPYSDGRRCISLTRPDSATGTLIVSAVGEDLSVTGLAQTGEIPGNIWDLTWIAALGPSGLLVVTMDGSEAWLGVPTAD